MTFETRVTRQGMPMSSYQPNGMPPLDGTHVVNMTPPDLSGDWRYREMKVLEPSQFEPSYSVAGGNYNVPSKSTVTPYEILVVWERYRGKE